ncbi:MAG: methyltransferase domain-containing protein [Chloroflexota bacterium]|nr:methyltransferase domain-containing protein [Chloroflexota bacterium]
MDPDRLRRTFDQDAELYDRARPGYPAELFEDLATEAGLRAGSRILEIGCGTGQATVPLAERGYEIVCVELGAELAAVARRKLARFPSVEVAIAPFESWPLPPRAFDAVVSATAFHWIDAQIRVTKSADALRLRGALATISTHHVAGGDERFFAAVQACYERWDPGTTTASRLPKAGDIASNSQELDRSGRFGTALFRRHEWDATYSTGEYLDLLRTYSGHGALDPPAREGLVDCIGDLIQTHFHGRVTKRYLTELRIAARSS